MTVSVRATAKSEPAIDVIGRFIQTARPCDDPEALARSRRAFLDTIGCMLLGADHEATRIAKAAVSRWGSGDLPVVGTDSCLAAPWAAMVNATSAHSLDYDDWDIPGLTHTSAVLVPAILAAASPSATGLDLFDAHIVGTEVILRIGEAVNMSHYERGWHATNTIGAIGATAACARLMRLDAEASANALSLATSMAGGYTIQFGTTAKPLHAGFAAKSGVLAATLAASGASGRRTALDDALGFAGLLSDAGHADFAIPLAKLGNPWGILEHGLYTKLYPSCGGTHLAIEAAERIRAEHELDPEDIERVDVTVSDVVSQVLPYGIPKTAAEALFSLPWCVATALIDGRVGIDSFSDEALERKDIARLARRIVKDVHPRHGSDVFHEDFADQVVVKKRSGGTIVEAVAFPLGAPQRPADDSHVERKFFDCATRRISEIQASKIHSLLELEPAVWTVSALSSLLSG